jgi:hypothetical protein
MRRYKPLDLTRARLSFQAYLSVGSTAFLTGYIAQRYELRPAPICLGVGMPSWGVGAEDEALKMSVRILSLFGHRDYAALRQTKGMNERASARRRN